MIELYEKFLNFLINLLNPLAEQIDKVLFFSVLIAIVLALIPKIDFIADKISKFFMIISGISLIVLTFLVSYDVITRKLFSGGSIALQELEWHLYDIVFLFGIGYTLSKDKHVRVDIIYNKLPFRVKKVINLLGLLFFVVPLATLIIFEAIPFVQMSLEQNESSGDPGGLPYRWIIKSTMIWAFLVVYIQAVGEIRKNFYMLIKGEK